MEYKLICTRTDNAPEILKLLYGWRRRDGVKVQVTEAYTSHQNGPAERSIQSTENNIRAMIDDAQLPVEFWCEAAEAQAYERARMRRGPVIFEEETLLNGSVRKTEKQISPEQAWTGKEPSGRNIRIWGCKAYSHVSRDSQPEGERTDKLIPIGRDVVFMGYSNDTDKHYRVYAPDLHRTVISSTVRFDETKPGGSIQNFRLWMEQSNGEFVEAPGTPNVLPVRNKLGRPSSNPSSAVLNAMKPPVVAFQSPAFRDFAASPIISEPMSVDDPKTDANPSNTSPSVEKSGDAMETEKPESEQSSSGVADAVSGEASPLGNSTSAAATTSAPADIPNTSQSEPPPINPPGESTATNNENSPASEDISVAHGKRHPDPHKWTLPSDKPIENPTSGRYSFRRQAKRSYAETLADEDEEEETNKRQKAMMAMLDWFDEELDDDFCEIALVAATAKGVDLGISIPKTYKEAVSGPHAKQWKEAIRVELEQLMLNGTWREEVPPELVNKISTKWVFTLKFHADGRLERFKARLVARGFSQAYGIDYTETFAPTVRMGTLRTFFAIVACEDLHCEHYDIKNAFTESELENKLYLSIPEGVENVKPGHALRLLRSLYGLKQAARDWNQLMKKELLGWGFVQSKGDPCLYTHPTRGVKILVYVDDIAAAAKDQSQLDWFWKKLDSRFTATNLREIKKILGVRITRDRKEGTLELDQEQYLDKVLTKYGFEHAKSKPISTPIDDYQNLRPANKKDKRIDATWYREVIGSLMYAMVYTRIDIAFILGRLAQYMQDPAEHHGQAVKRLMRYLRSTISLRICFGQRKGADAELEVFSDADYAADKVDRKSITAFVGLIGGGPIFWGSKKQSSVSTATTEAEYIAMCTTAKQGQWIAQVLRDMGYPEYIAPNGTTVQMRGDNQGAIALAKNPHLTERSKHIEVQYHYVRELQERGKANITYVPTDKMAADALTKPASKTLLERLRKQVGMVLPKKESRRQWEFGSSGSRNLGKKR